MSFYDNDFTEDSFSTDDSYDSFYGPGQSQGFEPFQDSFQAFEDSWGMDNYNYGPTKFMADGASTSSGSGSGIAIAIAAVAGVVALVGAAVIVRKFKSNASRREEKNRSVLASSPRESVLTL